MNFIFFTPTTISSAIGRMSQIVVCELLTAGHSVKVISSQSNQHLKDERIDFGCETKDWIDDGFIQAHIKSDWHVVYQIGDHFPFHEGCLRWLPTLGGLVCLHDFFVGSLFWGWSQNNREAAKVVLDYWYGEYAFKEFFSYPDPESFVDGASAKYPMTEWICSLADSVITHSSWGMERVLASCPGPSRIAPLPYNRLELSSAGDSSNSSSSVFRIVTIGNINANKRVAKVIEAIGSSDELKTKIKYFVVGSIEEKQKLKLQKFAQKNQVNIEVLGRVSDQELQSQLDSAHVISCLRYPALEAASASAIEGMLSAKPVLVTDTGFYRDLPSEHVYKISIDNEVENIAEVLAWLIHNPKQRAEKAELSAEWAKEKFQAIHYRHAIEELCAVKLEFNPLYKEIEAFIEQLVDWGATDEILLILVLVEKMGIFSSD